MGSTCVGLWNCVQHTLGPQIWAITQVIVFYLLFTSLLVGWYTVTEGVTLNGLSYEISAFVDEYRDTSIWWITSLTASIIALTIEQNSGLLLDIAILSIFFLPGVYYFNQFYPFTLDCNFRATTDDNRTDLGRDRDNIAVMGSNGECGLELRVQTGSAVDEFCFQLEVPEGVSTRNIPTSVAGLKLTSDDKIKGKASPGVENFWFELMIEQDGNIVSGRNNLIITDDESGRTLEVIKIVDR